MWLVAIFLPGCAVCLSSSFFDLQVNVTYTNAAFSSHEAANRQQCATRCDRLEPEYCDGFRSCGPELRAVCEAPQSARLPRGCPPTWLEIDTYCYLAVSQALTFHQADQHCGQLAGGARLGHPHGPGVHTILEAYASRVGISGNFWVGVRDEASEGTWQSMDGSAWHFAWSPVHYQPNGGTSENCVTLDAELG
ncbi:tetranectin-like, partial [Pollicipes pollicipes]|uniref:tetranectin-like n=1 Tax=Pollicipes pollicipes TaxID=41117 RepID=UPI001884E71A